MRTFRLLFPLAGLLLATVTPALAAVLALAPTSRGALHVVDVATHNSTVLEASACCAVQAGSVAADTVNHRVFFIANHAGGSADLYTFGYGAGAAVVSVPLGGADRVTHLAYDAANTRLLGFAAPDTGGIEVVSISPGSGAVIVNGAPGAACCMLRAGVVAYQSGTLFAVGRRSTDTQDQLLAFSASNGTLQNAWDLGGRQVAQIVSDGGTLYGLASAQNSTTLQLGTFAFTPAFQFTAIGSGAADCCFVLAGAAAVDHAGNALVALSRASSAPGPFAIRAFSLASGSVSVGGTLQAMGLFEDSAVLFDRIFADGFEGSNPAAAALRKSR